MFKPKPIVAAIALILGNPAHADLNSGLIAHYTFDDCTAKDVSGNGYDGLIHWRTTSNCVAGARGIGAFLNYVDGVNEYGFKGGEYVSLPTFPALWINGFTGCVWASFQNDDRFWERLFDIGNGPVADNILLSRNLTTTTLCFDSYIGSSPNCIDATSAIVNNVFKLYCGTIDGVAQKLRLYVDGIKVIEGNGNYNNVTRVSNFIGRSNWHSYDADFRGIIDDVRFYSRTLTDAEILQLYQGAITPPAVSTDAPSVITPTSVKLTGTVNPNNATTTVSFDFGLTNSYGTSINATPNSIPATATATGVSADKADLNCNTEYFYRIKASNSAGTSLGTERSFTTSTCPPVNAWLYPVNPTVIVDHDFTLDLHVDSHGVKIGSYDFQINFDKERLVVDDTKCDNGVCPGTDTVDTSTVVTNNNTGVIKVAGFDMDGVGPNNDLQLLVIHFKTKITPGPTLIDLTTNELATVLGEVIGLGSRDNLVTISPGICGDSDRNGAVNIVDALAIARRAVGLPPPPTVNTLWADVNQNQVTNITDAMLIARHSVGMLVVGTCDIGQALPFSSHTLITCK